MKIVYTVILFFCLSILSVADNSNHENLLHKCLEPIVLIDSEDNQSSGSGFIVKSLPVENLDCFFNIVFSCEHIIKSSKVNVKKTVYDENGIHKKYDVYNGYVYALDKSDDLSIMFFISRNKMPETDINFDYKPKIKDKLFAVGHGLGDTARYTEGLFTGIQKDDSTVANINYRTSIPIIFGDSGCPLFYDNKVIGVAISLRTASYGNMRYPVYDISYFKPISIIMNLVKEIKLENKNFEKVKIPLIIANYLWSKDIVISEN